MDAGTRPCARVNAHNIDGIASGAVKNPVMLNRQDFKGWFHGGSASGRVAQNNVEGVIEAGAVFGELRLAQVASV